MTSLKVDGGVTASDLTMQRQADILGLDVIRPVVPETTALGAGYAAGLAVGVWDTPDDFRENWHEDRRWVSRIDTEARAAGVAAWHKAVDRTLNWVEE
jgi:glycerol kinase